jgi:hypothetical protein
VQFGADKNGTWILTINAGPEPYADGLGFDISSFTTAQLPRHWMSVTSPA